MKRVLVALALVAFAAPAFAQTPAATVAATPAADAGSVRSQAGFAPPGKMTFKDIQTFEGGVQVGTTSGGAAALTFIARGTCTVNPNQLGAGDVQNVTCAAPGALANDTVLGAIATVSDTAAVSIMRAAATTDSVTFKLVGLTAAQNLGAVVINYLVVR